MSNKSTGELEKRLKKAVSLFPLDSETSELESDYLLLDSDKKNDVLDPYAFQLCSPDDIYARNRELGSHNRTSALSSILTEMKATDGLVSLRPLKENYAEALDELDNQYPHFERVTSYIRQKLFIASLRKYPYFNLGANILIDGPAGTGKSSYAMKLAELMGTESCMISCAAASNGFDLTGLSGGWGNGRAGKIHSILVTRRCANPIIILDEIEKAKGDNKSTFTGALYGLLERQNAKQFKDEYVDVSMNASMINWIATSNQAELLDPPILDRFEVLTVREPSTFELKKIIPNLYNSILEKHGIQNLFAKKLDNQVVDYVAKVDGVSIRKVSSMIDRAISSSLLRFDKKSRRKLTVNIDDLPQDRLAVKHRNPMGFIW